MGTPATEPAPPQALAQPGTPPKMNDVQQGVWRTYAKEHGGVDNCARMVDADGVAHFSTTDGENFVMVLPNGTQVDDYRAGVQFWKAGYTAYIEAREAGDKAKQEELRPGYRWYRRFYKKDIDARKASGELTPRPRTRREEPETADPAAPAAQPGGTEPQPAAAPAAEQAPEAEQAPAVPAAETVPPAAPEAPAEAPAQDLARTNVQPDPK